MAEKAPLGSLGGPLSRLSLGPRSSRSERLKGFGICQKPRAPQALRVPRVPRKVAESHRAVGVLACWTR
eukprot:9870110-Alexandrium_andersonii.AAC.1